MSNQNGNAKNRTLIEKGLYEIQQAGKPTRWLAIVKKDGRQLSRAVPARTRTEARDLAPGIVAELKNEATQKSTLLGDHDVTLRQLRDGFLAHEAGPSRKLSPRTRALRETLLDKHVLPGLGSHTKARELTGVHVRQLISKLQSRGLSGSHIRSIVTSLSAILDYGIKWHGGLKQNVCRTQLVPDDLPSGARQSEPRYLTHDEVQQLLLHMTDTFRPVAAVAFYAGLRASEILALRWSDVRLDEHLIELVNAATKTASSRKPIPILPELEQELREHRQRLVNEGTFVLHGLVFPTASGRPQSRRNALRAVNVAAQHAGLWSPEDGREPVGLHDLRHSLAAYLRDERGLKIASVSRFLRHKDVRVTEVIYGGFAKSENEQALDLREELLAAGGAS